jgi:hypothetical protein
MRSEHESEEGTMVVLCGEAEVSPVINAGSVRV